jgi:ArsR family transcriptional regulator
VKNSPLNYHDEGWAKVCQVLYDISVTVFFLGECMKTFGSGHAGRSFRALSNPTRLRILNLLLCGETCVSDIASTLRIPQRTALRYLADLRRVGLLESRRDEHRIYYTLTEPQTRFHSKLIECLRCCFDDATEFAVDTAQLKLSRYR